MFTVVLCLFTFMVLNHAENESLNDEKDETILQHSSCLSLDDGEHYIRPYVDGEYELPSILVRCYKGWTVLDYSLDTNVKKYFRSLMHVHDNFATMDVSTHHANWDEWFKVDDVIFATSQDCQSCNAHINAAYYMTGNYYGCAFATKALCDMDQATLECYSCGLHDTSGVATDEEYHGLCAHVELDTDNKMVDDLATPHDKCVTYKWNYLPSLGTTGEYCTCFRPSDAELDKEVDAMFMEQEVELYDEDNDYLYDDTCDSLEDRKEKVYELYNSDFEKGTYRIRKCGTYKLMEDITLNMNAPSDPDYTINSLNDHRNLHWFPLDEQTMSNDDYPSHNFIGAYAMGFFSGISVEVDNVKINLNGYEMKMHSDFYLQQRFFSLIELGSKPFISGQGPANFGNINVHFAQNIVVENGILGLSSHHGIHGNNNNNVHLRNLRIHNFEVNGIQFNGFDELTIHDVEIGPNYQNVPLTAMYTHARFMIQRLGYIPDLDDAMVTISDQELPARQIIHSLQSEMNEALTFAHESSADDMDVPTLFNQNTFDEDNLYINFDGLPHGATLYGIFLNSFGASVFGLGLSPGKSSNVELRNIYIHDLVNNPVETIRYKLNRGPFNDLLDIKRIVAEDGSYQGTSYSDAQFAIHKLIPDNWWSVLGHIYINDEMTSWIESGGPFDLYATSDEDRTNVEDGTTSPLIKCNSDVMVHLTKGIFGLRIDNVNKIDMKGYIRVHGLHNLGDFGEAELCGNYYSSKDGGHDEQTPFQVGYTGTEVHGITLVGSSGHIEENARIEIKDLMSARGSVYGMNIYSNNDFNVHRNSKVIIEDLHAGAFLTSSDVEALRTNQELALPNTVPRSCAIDLWDEDEFNTVFKIHEGRKGNDGNFKVKCITNHDQCSFDFNKIDKSITKPLNDDLLSSYIDNSDCELIQNEQFIGFEEAQYVNDQHQKSFTLLSLQKNEKFFNNNHGDSPQDKIEQVINEEFQFELYGAVILFIIVITLVVAVYKCLKSNNKEYVSHHHKSSYSTSFKHHGYHNLDRDKFVPISNLEETIYATATTPLINKKFPKDNEEEYIK